MNPKEQFLKYKSRFLLEGLSKSLMVSLSIGFVGAFIAALVTWFFSGHSFWFSILVFAGLTAIALPILYFKKFKSSIVDKARSLDKVGLEERVITMVEYQDDDSCIVGLQRADAQQKLTEVSPSQVKIKLPRKMVLTTVLCAVFAVAMTVVSALSASGILMSGEELMDNIIPEPPVVYIAVSYIVEEGGYIEGEMDQLVAYGTNADPVMAMAEEGYAFVEWDDGRSDPSRADKKIIQEMVFTAVFAPIEEEGEGGEGGDAAGNPMDGEPGEEKGENQGGDGEADEEGEPSDSSGGKYDEWNQIIDGKKYYREFLEDYKERLIEQLEKDGDSLTEEERAIIEAYINLV